MSSDFVELASRMRGSPYFPSEYGLVDTYQHMNPGEVKQAGGIKVGDTVYWKKSERVAERVWGKKAGEILEIRVGRSGPTMISSRGIGVAPVMYNIGPRTAVASIRAPDGHLDFSQVRDLRKA